MFFTKAKFFNEVSLEWSLLRIFVAKRYSNEVSRLKKVSGPPELLYKSGLL